MAWAEFRKTKTGTATRINPKTGEVEKGSFYVRDRVNGKAPTRPVRTGLQKTVKDMKRQMENDKADGKLGKGDGVSIEEAFAKYEKLMADKPDNSPLTWPKYKRELAVFFKFLGKGRSVTSIEREDMDDYRDSLLDDGYHINSVFGIIGVAAAFLTFCRKRKFIKFNPASNVMEEYNKIDTSVKFTDTEIRQIVDCIDNPLYVMCKRNWVQPRNEFKAIIQSTLLTGFREGDVAKFKCSWLVDKLIYVEDGKGGKNRIVPASGALLTILAPYLNRGKEYVFQGWSENRIKCQWANLYQRAKEVYPTLPVKGTFHSLRHTFAKNFLRGGGNPKKLQLILGHSSIKTTLDLYGDLDAEELGPDMENVKAGWLEPHLAVI